jgi:hypothetical protein
VGKILKQEKNKPEKWIELDEIFEKTFRPLLSNNARHIYLILRDSKEDYLTTYDMQPILEKQGNKLSKVEINNWLSTLQESELVIKSKERGKPTTRSYTRRYTFDLWKLSKKGIETAVLLEDFLLNSPTQNDEKSVEITKIPKLEETTMKDHKKIKTLFMHISLLETLMEKHEMDLETISRETGLKSSMIIEFIQHIEKSSSNSLYSLSETPINIGGKILQTFGLSPKMNYIVSLNRRGVEMLSILSPR